MSSRRRHRSSRKRRRKSSRKRKRHCDDDSDDESDVATLDSSPPKSRRVAPSPPSDDSSDSEPELGQGPPWTPGRIRRISIHNFLSYRSADFFPGPGLNLIIGPNGAGKSTITSALCVGLGGPITVLKRGQSLRTYIRSGSMQEPGSTSWVELEIYEEDEEQREDCIIVRREIRQNESKWRINDRRAQLRDVEELAKKYHISFENLTMYLPQERVSEFPALSGQERLKLIQQLLCAPNVLEMHKELIKLQSGTKERTDAINKLRLRVVREQHDRDHFQELAQSYVRKKALLRKIDLIRVKTSFQKFTRAQEAAKLIKAELDAARKKLREFQGNKSPLQKEIDATCREKKKFGDLKYRSEQMRRKLARDVEKFVEKLREARRASRELEKKRSHLLDRVRRTLQKKSQLEQQIREYDTQIQSLRDPKVVRQETRESGAKILRAQAETARTEDAMAESRNQYRALERQRNLKESERARIGDVNRQKDLSFERFSRMHMQVLQWCRRNKQQFQGEVYLIGRSTDALRPEHASKVEYHVRNDVWKSFVVTNMDDQRMLAQRHSSGGFPFFPPRVTMSISCFSPDLARQILSKPKVEPLQNIQRSYNVDCYLSDCVKAPPEVLAALISRAKLDKVVVMKTHLQKQNLKRSILRLFAETKVEKLFTEDSRYQHRKSSYGGHASDEINPFPNNPPKILKPVRVDRMNAINQELAQIQQRMSVLQAEVNAKREENSAAYQREQVIRKAASALRREVQQYTKLVKLRKRRKEELDDVQITNVKEEERRLCQNIRLRNHARVAMVKDQQPKVNDWSKCIDECVKAELMFEKLSRKEQVLLHQQEKELAQLRELENRVNSLKENYRSDHAKLRAIRDEAVVQKTAVIAKYQIEADAFRTEMGKLSDDLELLESERIEHQNAADLLYGTADDVRKYEVALEQCRKLAEELRVLEQDEDGMQKRIDLLRDEWKAPVEARVGQVDGRFRDLCQGVGIAGEVNLNIQNSDHSKSSLEIQVAFRGSKVQTLSSSRQSGGEQSVTTVLFILALQAETQAPFFVLDEINQGMDERNDRKIFKQIVRTSREEDVAQAFLITPKLRPDLIPTEPCGMNVFVIMAGPYGITDDQMKASEEYVAGL